MNFLLHIQANNGGKLVKLCFSLSTETFVCCLDVLDLLVGFFPVSQRPNFTLELPLILFGRGEDGNFIFESNRFAFLRLSWMLIGCWDAAL